MTRLADSSKPRLSFEQANAICRHWVVLGDQAHSHFEKMLGLGFEAFTPRNTYIESFAANETQLATHRRYVAETVKERLGQPKHIPMTDDEVKQIYFSPFLQSLRQQRDQENGCSETELSKRFEPGESSWRREIDPCQRNLVKDGAAHKVEHRARFEAVLKSEKQLSIDEAQRYSPGRVQKGHMFDEKDRCAHFADVMRRDAASLGFEFDKARSRVKRPLFFKPLTEDWHLCWSIHDRDFFFSPVEGRFLPSLHLCSRKAGNPREVTEPFQTLHIRYDALIYGFTTAYWHFHDFDQLERAIKAHLQLYSLVSETIESGIKKVLDPRPY